MGERMIIVGAGALGLAIAERLAAKAGRVIVVDQGLPGGGTSGTSFGWLNANAKVPRSYHRLNVDAVEVWRRAANDRATAPWLHLNGRIQWAEAVAEIGELDRATAAMRAWDYPVESITLAEARRLEPDLRIAPRAEVLLWPSEGFLVPPAAIEWLVTRARSSGVEILTAAPVAGFGVRRGAVRGIVLEDGSALEADHVVTCAGRWTESLLSTAGVHVPLHSATPGSPSLGLLGYTTAAETRLARTITGPGLNVRPDTTTGRYVLQGIGLDHLAIPGESPDPGGEVGRELIARARSLMAGFEAAHIDEVRVGYRAVPADRVTVAGWAPGIGGLYVVATHSGWTLALHLGELVAREVADGTVEPALADFRPDRFAAPVAAAVVESRPVH